MAKISLSNSIEATKLHPKTGTSLGLPDVTISYGALIEYVGPDRDREKFKYLGELYACRRETFQSATGGVNPAPPTVEAKAAPPPEPAPAPAREPRLEWDQLKSSDYSVWRAAVPGGWLVAVNGSSVTFVPDSRHQWDGGSPE